MRTVCVYVSLLHYVCIHTYKKVFTVIFLHTRTKQMADGTSCLTTKACSWKLL